jgi:hypothetical protein
MTFYKHNKKTEPTYQVLNAGEVQIDNVWYPCVIYRDIDSKKVYVRQEIDFDNKFKII